MNRKNTDMGVFNLIPFFFLCFFLILIHHTSFTEAEMDNKNGDVINGNVSNLAAPSPPPLPPPSMARSRITPFKPSIAIVVGILTIIFSITFLLLLYFKHCKTNTYSSNYRSYPLSRRNSGINRKVIESLPMFRFSSLSGQKDGLECAVCLNKFEGNEVLRLLPKCKHAFHVECVDTWLDAHSTCPLCRYRVDAEDVLLVDYHSDQFTPRTSDQGKIKEFAKPRISGRHSSAGERGRNSNSLEIIAENPKHDSRGRISLDSWKSSRKKEKDGHGQMAENPGKAFRKDGHLPVQVDKRRLEHRIIVSTTEEEVRRRWSDVEAASVLCLRSEMIMGGEEGSGTGVINERSVSEITGVSRYGSNNGGKEEREKEEERIVKRWLDWKSQSQEQQRTAVSSVRLSSSSSSAAIVDV